MTDGLDVGPEAQGLNALIARAAAAPATAPANDPGLALVLAAFRQAADAPATTRAAGRRRRTFRSLMVRCATIVLVISGAGLAVATTGALPTPIQSVAHRLLGAAGIPAPSNSGAQPSTGTGRGTSSAPASSTPSPSATASSAITALCTIVAANSKDWRSLLGTADQALLISVAGGDQKVKGYCSRLLAGPSSSATASPTPTDTSSATPTPQDTPTSQDTPTPQDTTTHGNPHATHSPGPNPHSSNH